MVHKTIKPEQIKISCLIKWCIYTSRKEDHASKTRSAPKITVTAVVVGDQWASHQHFMRYNVWIGKKIYFIILKSFNTLNVHWKVVLVISFSVCLRSSAQKSIFMPSIGLLARLNSQGPLGEGCEPYTCTVYTFGWFGTHVATNTVAIQKLFDSISH